MTRRIAIAAALVFIASSVEAFVKCRTVDGAPYFGDVPPPRCQVEGVFSDAPPPPTVVGGPDEPVAVSADSGVTLEALEANAALDLETRKAVSAVRVVGDHVYDNEGFLEGKVANGAEFTVYNVRVCASRTCQPATPATLLAGAHASFRFPSEVQRDAGAMVVTWDVEPLGNTRADSIARSRVEPARVRR